MTFLKRHLSGEAIGHFPVWMMRQAGRYLPQYRALRKKATFWEMVTNAELVKSVTLMPLEVMPVDAVILFSDILTLPYSVGISIELKDKHGPVLEHPLRSPQDFGVFESFEPEQHTPYVRIALTGVREKVNPLLEVIGFVGGPWTVATYLVEGGTSRSFERIRTWAYEDPQSLAEALTHLTHATIRHLHFQLKSGAGVVQIFDTWLCTAPREFIENYYLPLLGTIMSSLGNQCVIYFAKQCPMLMGPLSELGFGVLGVDSSVRFREAERYSGGKVSLQGNLDPVVLLGTTPTVRRLTRELVKEARSLVKPPILNLGHGILPQTPLENAIAFVEEAKALWI